MCSICLLLSIYSLKDDWHSCKQIVSKFSHKIQRSIILCNYRIILSTCRNLCLDFIIHALLHVCIELLLGVHKYIVHLCFCAKYRGNSRKLIRYTIPVICIGTDHQHLRMGFLLCCLHIRYKHITKHENQAQYSQNKTTHHALRLPT